MRASVYSYHMSVASYPRYNVTSQKTHAHSCGDGIRAGSEQCDDADLMDGDGCSSKCTVEQNYQCRQFMCAASTCDKAICGDGYRQGIEATIDKYCDDANLEPGDGCSAACRAECGFDCGQRQPSVCLSDCGDGVKVCPLLMLTSLLSFLSP